MKSENAQNISYSFDHKKEDLNAYAELVMEYYKKDLKLDLQQNNMADSLYRLDRNETILIVKDDDRVIGGSKIIFSHLTSNQLLPLESEKFRINNILPKEFGNYSYCEYARLVLHPDYRGKTIISRLVATLTDYAIQQGAGLITLMAPPINAVLYRRVCKGLGMPMQIRNDIEVDQKAAYQQLGLKLITCDVRQLNTSEMSHRIAA